MNFFDRFKQQLLESDLGELRLREKMEFFPKVAAHAYYDERAKLANFQLASMGQYLAKVAAETQAANQSRDVKEPSSEE